jgi:YHS domain-containing protein
MKIPTETRRLTGGIVATLALLVATVSVVVGMAEAGPRFCRKPSRALRFAKPKYIDKHRAGGEPTVEQHPDGTLIYGAHAGSTHFYAPAGADPTTAAFVENYTGQTYYYYSKNNGRTWKFAPRRLSDNLPAQGFSDPESAIDKAGNLYISEINLVNVAVSKSTNSGRSYKLQNFFGQTIHDRQWMAADQKNVLYMVGNSFGGGTAPTQPVGNLGHYLYKSTNGGKTFSAGILDEKGGSGLGDLQVNHSDGTLYEAHYDGKTLSLAAFRHARHNRFGVEVNPIARKVEMLSHWPAFDLDARGNLYIVWDESGRGGRAAGIWYSYSKNRGRTWTKPVRVDADAKTNIWPWLAVGTRGRVAIAYLEASKKLPNHDAETPGDHGWRVIGAQSLNGLGCKRSNLAGFRRATATRRPVHRGTICQGGTVCQAMGIDRRLGDFFTIEIDKTGAMWAGYSDTRQGGAVALPGFVRQSGGASFLRTGR